MPDDTTAIEESTALPELPFPSRRRASSPAAQIGFDPLGGGDIGSLPESQAPMEDVDRRAEITRKRGGGNVPKFPSLETMYSAYPELRRTGKLRVQRIEPEWFYDEHSRTKMRISGIVGMHETMISTQEFLRTYGGYKYRVYGVLEQGDPGNAGGPPAFVDIAVAEFSIPVDPNMSSLPIADDVGESGVEMNMPFLYPPGSPYGGRRQQPMQQPQQNDGGTIGPMLSFAERMVAHAQPQQQQQPIPDTVFNVMGRQTERQIDATKEMAQQQVALLERQLQSRDAELSEMRRQIASINDKPNDMVEMVKAVALINSSVRGSASSDEMKVIQEQHQHDMEARQREFERLIEIEKREKERDVSRAREDMQLRVAAMEERLREKEASVERRERELKDEFERRERSLRDENKRALESMERALQQRIEDAERAHDRELRLRDSIEKNTKTTLDAAHGFEVRALQNQLAVTVADLQAKAKMVDAHLAEQNKPLIQKVQELKQLATDLGIAPEDKEGPEDPLAAAAAAEAAKAPFYQKMLLTVISQADTLIPQIKSLLSKGDGTQAPQQVSVQQVPPAQQARANLPPPRRQHRVQFADPEGPRVMATNFDDLPAPTVSADELNRMSPRSPGMPPVPFNPNMQQSPIAPPVVPPQPMQVVQQPAYPPPAVIQQAPPPPVVQQPVAQAQEPMQPATYVRQPTPQNVAPAKQPWSSFNWIPGLNQEQVADLMNTIRGACERKVPSSELVAEFVKQNGEGVVATIPHFIDKDRLIASIREDPATKSTVLATGKGKRYLDDLWKTLVKLQQEFVAKEQAKEAQVAKPEEAPKE